MEISNTWASGYHLAAASLAFWGVIYVLAPGGIITFPVESTDKVLIYVIYNGVSHFSATRAL